MLLVKLCDLKTVAAVQFTKEHSYIITKQYAPYHIKVT